jgi:hypothetical protein
MNPNLPSFNHATLSPPDQIQAFKRLQTHEDIRLHLESQNWALFLQM